MSSAKKLPADAGRAAGMRAVASALRERFGAQVLRGEPIPSREIAGVVLAIEGIANDLERGLLSASGKGRLN